MEGLPKDTTLHVDSVVDLDRADSGQIDRDVTPVRRGDIHRERRPACTVAVAFPRASSYATATQRTS